MSQLDGVPDTRPQEITGRTVVGLFGHRAGAEAAIRDLRAAGFPEDRMGVAMQEQVVAVGMSEEDARHFDAGLRSGGTLVAVDAGARTPEALAILQRHEVDFGPSGALRFDGEERRVFFDPAYPGPERRLIGS